MNWVHVRATVWAGAVVAMLALSACGGGESEGGGSAGGGGASSGSSGGLSGGSGGVSDGAGGGGASGGSSGGLSGGSGGVSDGAGGGGTSGGSSGGLSGGSGGVSDGVGGGGASSGSSGGLSGGSGGVSDGAGGGGASSGSSGGLSGGSGGVSDGAGGGGTSGGSSGSWGTPIADPIQTSVAPPTYTGALLQAYNFLSSSLANCGFGALRQDPNLDAAAANHAAYVAQHLFDGYYPHLETPGKAGFTGVEYWDRQAAAGYRGLPAGEVEVGISLGFSTAYKPMKTSDIEAFTPLTNVRHLLNAPYHGMAMLLGVQDVGFASRFRWKESLQAGATVVEGAGAVVVSMGKRSLNGQQPSDPNAVRTYPCEGSIDVGYELTGEWVPGGSLAPGRDVGANPFGTTIYAVGQPGSTISIQSVNVIELSTGRPVPIYEIRNRANDPNPQVHPGPHMAYVLLDRRLNPGQRYQVSMSGMINGRPYTRQFTYTTSTQGEFSTELIKYANSL